MVLGTHPAKPYLRRIWFAPFSCWHFHCTPPTAKPPTSGKHARRLFRRSIRQAISSAFTGVLNARNKLETPRLPAIRRRVGANRHQLPRSDHGTAGFTQQALGINPGGAIVGLFVDSNGE